MNQKPKWLLYADSVREKLANKKDTKSGKRSEMASRLAWQNACRDFGYEASFDDW